MLLSYPTQIQRAWKYEQFSFNAYFINILLFICFVLN